MRAAARQPKLGILGHDDGRAAVAKRGGAPGIRVDDGHEAGWPQGDFRVRTHLACRSTERCGEAVATARPQPYDDTSHALDERQARVGDDRADPRQWSGIRRLAAGGKKSRARPRPDRAAVGLCNHANAIACLTG